MENNIFQEENHVYRFDFSAAVWATDQLHELYHECNVSLLSDADFIAETEKNIIVVEYKNANIAGAANPEAFRPTDDKLLNKIAFKYYDTWIYLKALQKKKPIIYVYILEHPNGDSTTRRSVKSRITPRLPFALQNKLDIGKGMISEFLVLSIDEWNQDERFKVFPITKVPTETDEDTTEETC